MEKIDATVEQMTDYESDVEEDKESILESLLDQVASMHAQRNKKLNNALDSIDKQLEMMAVKYKTANGVALIYDTIKDYEGLVPQPLEMARYVALKMSNLCLVIKEHVNEEESLNDFDKIMDNFIDPEFAETMLGIEEFITELSALQLAQQVGGNLSDIKEFAIASKEEIEKVNETIKEYDPEANTATPWMELCYRWDQYKKE